MKDVIVFRHQLFKVSEPFIALQVEQLTKYRPLYLGRTCFGKRPESAEVLSFDDQKKRSGFVAKLWQVATRDPVPYLELLRGEQPSLIHAHFGVEGVYALPLALRLGVPLVTTFHGFDATTSSKALIASGKPSWINYALFRKKLAKSGALFLCVSEFIRKRVIELGFPEERTRLHYIGMDVQGIEARSFEEEQAVVLHVARLVEKKGTEYLVKAFAHVVSEEPDVRLLIIGDGPLRSSLQSLAGSLGLGQQVSFLGARPHEEVLLQMRKSTMLVLSSVTAESGDAEGLGMVLLEAAALGVPTIGTDHGGIPEAIIDGCTGYLVKERDVDALAQRILCLVRDRQKRRDMGLRARDLVEQRFDIRKQSAKLEDLYDSVIR